MKAVFLLSILLFALPALADIWTSCGNSNDLFQIGAVSIVPDPPVKGQNLTVTASGKLTQTVDDSTIALEVKYGIVTVLKQTDDVCTLDPKACPAPAGAWNQSITVAIPDNVPSGGYTAQATLTDKTSGAEIACVKVAFKL